MSDPSINNTTVNEVADTAQQLSPVEAIDSTPYSTPPDLVERAHHDVITVDRKTPLPGHIYKIVSVKCSRQVMILDGQVVLARTDELGSSYWSCEQHDTWLSFRNTATGKILGHDSGSPGLIRCDAQSRQHWEQLLAIPHTRTEGAFSLLAEYWFGQRSIGLCEMGGTTRLCRIADILDPGVAWAFLEVDDE